MTGECLPWAEIPHTTPLFLDFLYQFPKVGRFYARPPWTRDWLPDESSKLTYDHGRRHAVAAVMERQNRAWSASAATMENIARLRAEAAAVVTGQQVALFGGPLMGLLKAISAARQAADATARGVSAVPVFWLATEDHDLAEVNHVTIPADDGQLRKLVAQPQAPEHAPVGEVRFGPEIEALVNEAVSLLPGSEIGDALRRSYRPGETFGTAFARLLAFVLGDLGVIILDSSDPELDVIGAPVYRAAAVAASELTGALMQRGKELRAAGYHEQVKVTPASTLLFRKQNGARVPVHRVNGNFALGDDRISAQELEARVAAAPQEFSANVLLRPVLQDYLLPTIAYFGGPSEIAYFAQAAVVYEEILGRVTPVLPRFSATLVDARSQRLLQQYGLKLPGLFEGPEHVREKLGARALSADIQEKFAEARAQSERLLAAIRESLIQLDATLAGAADRASSKMLYQLERLRTRAARAQLRRNAEIERQANWLSFTLYPNKTLQEREIASVWFLAHQGRELIPRLYECIQESCPDHQVLYL